MNQNKLFQSVAIDPAAARNLLVCMVLKHKFGLANGRFITGVPRSWFRVALQQINSINDENLKRKLKCILEALEKSKAMIPEDIEFDPTKPWIQAASSEAVQRIYDVLVTDENVEFNPLYSSENIDEYIEASEKCVGYLDVATLRQAKDFIAVLAPFLKIHKKIVLVNRYQWLLSTKEVRDLFETVFQYWARLDGKDFTVIRSSVVKEPKWRSFDSNWNLEKEMLTKYLKRIRFEGTFRFIAVNDESEKLHHRYLLGDHCGISLDYGFEMVGKKRRHPWQLLNAAHFSEARKRFFINDVVASDPVADVFHYSLNGRRISV